LDDLEYVEEWKIGYCSGTPLNKLLNLRNQSKTQKPQRKPLRKIERKRKQLLEACQLTMKYKIKATNGMSR